MNIVNQSQQFNSPSDFKEGCKQMSAEAGYAFRKILRDKLGIKNEIYLNECTKDFIKLILT